MNNQVNPRDPFDEIDSRILITISLSLQGNEPEAPWPDEYSFCLPAEDAAVAMEQMIQAVDDGRLFGWMMQSIAECAYGAGEWSPPPTLEERMAAASKDTTT